MLFWISFETHTGLPASVFPIGVGETGLPVGMQVIGPFLEDATYRNLLFSYCYTFGQRYILRHSRQVDQEAAIIHFYFKGIAVAIYS